MRYAAQQLEGLIDLLVEAVLRDLLEIEHENGDESVPEQRCREDQANEILSPGRDPRNCG